jgi:hypothetical protein
VAAAAVSLNRLPEKTAGRCRRWWRCWKEWYRSTEDRQQPGRPLCDVNKMGTSSAALRPTLRAGMACLGLLMMPAFPFTRLWETPPYCICCHRRLFLSNYFLFKSISDPPKLPRQTSPTVLITRTVTRYGRETKPPAALPVSADKSSLASLRPFSIRTNNREASERILDFRPV